MKTFILSMALLCAVSANAQSAWQWAKNFESSISANTRQFTTDSDGNIFVISTFKNAVLNIEGISLVNASPGTSDLCIIKYNSSGTRLWVKRFGGSSNDQLYSVCSDNAGNIIIAGRAQEGIEFDNYELNGPFAHFLAKIDEEGDVVWAIKGTGAYMFQDIECDAQGNIYTTGIAESASIGFNGVTAQFGQYQEDVNDITTFIAKFNSSGTCLWAQCGESSNDVLGNRPQSIAVDGAGNAYLAGYMHNSSLSFGNVSLTKLLSGNNTHSYLVKFNPDGLALWGDNMGCNLADKSARASKVVCNNTEVYVTGTYSGTATFGDAVTIENLSGIQMFIAKYNAAGTVQWVKKPDNPGGASQPDTAALDPAGNFYAAIFIRWTNLLLGNNISATPHPEGSLLLVKLNSLTGDVMSLKQIDNYPPGGTTAYISCPAENELIVSGKVLAPVLQLDDIALTRSSTYDVYIAKLAMQPLSTTLFTASDITVWPNPVKDVLYINSAEMIGRLEVYNISGQLIYTGQTVLNDYINLQSLTTGAYIVTLYSGDRQYKIKFLKE